MLNHRLSVLAAGTVLAISPVGPVVTGAFAQQTISAEEFRIAARDQAAEGELVQAQKSIEQALVLEPDNLDLQLARANILLWSNEAEAAITQADAVRSIDASYPGLADFDTAFLRQSRPPLQDGFKAGLLNVYAAAGVADLKFASGRAAQWENVVIAAAYRQRANTVFVGEVDAERREQLDVRISARATTQTKFGAYYFAAGVTPDAKFRDDWRMLAGVDTRLSRNLQGSFDLRVTHFGSGAFTAIEPGLTYDLSSRYRASGKMINLFSSDGQYRAGASLRLDFVAKDDSSVFIGAARYPDTEAGITQTLQAYSVGAAWSLDRNMRLRLAGAQETRKNSYRNRSVNFGLEFRLKAR